jgi:hypothetical protein
MKTMRLPSRFVPPRINQRRIFPGVLLLGALMVGLGYFVYSSSNLVRYVTAILVFAFCGYAAVINRRERHRFEAMASTREKESICGFARSFNTRQTDTWVIRAAHQELQLFLHSYVPGFPVRASDSLLHDLRLDSEDLEDLLLDIAARSGRSLHKPESNPYYGNVLTVSDLVLFINAQPRIMTV